MRVYGSFVRRELIAGIPSKIAIGLWTVVAALSAGLMQVWLIIPALCIHMPLALVLREDAYAIEAFFVSLRGADVYEL